MLLAKRTPGGGDPKGLTGHSLDVLAAAEHLFGTAAGPTPLGRAWLRFFKLKPHDWPAFHANLVAGALLHDIGKANDGFQRAMMLGGDQQIMRHEHLSALLLAWPAMQDWLRANALLRPELIISAVACHHLKASRKPPPGAGYRGFAERYTSHALVTISDMPGLAEVLDLAASRLNLPAPPTPPATWSFDDSEGEPVAPAAKRVHAMFSQLAKGGGQPLLAALKAALIAADGAGSGLPRTGEHIADWLEQCFSMPPLTAADIEAEVLGPRRLEIEQQRHRTDPGYQFQYKDFQLEAATLSSRALLLASCGVGKTVAAWRWIGGQLEQHEAGRVLFLYPTRATATEGFRDYVSHAPEATLLTGTAAYELRGMFDNPADPRADRGYETDARLFTIGAWQKRLFSATVDQFLGFMQQVYKSLCLLPMLADSVIVIDEVHSFDAGLFETLIRFLQHFDVPVLCMTASLPARRRERLEALGFELYPRESDDFQDLEQRAAAQRYQVERLDSLDQALPIAEDAVADGKRVLWVVNTVDRCQGLAQSLQHLEPVCYHSRFRLDDRSSRHRDVVARFADPVAGGLLAVTTQVCEMSLDLDADLLITEAAPIPSLIQRMGRCNRHDRPGRSLGQVLIYEPASPRPYDKQELDAARRFVDDLAGGAVSQARLDDLLEQYSRLDPAEGKRLSAFLDDGAWARGGAEGLRDGDDFTVRAVLDRDLDEGRWRPGGDGLIVPVPKRLGLTEPDRRLPRYLRRAPASHYSPQLGFMTHPIETLEGADS